MDAAAVPGGNGASGQGRVPLPGGATLVIRPVTRDDVEGLAGLYAGLSVDDLYRRFFSVYLPDRAFFERVATTPERGGFGLVAVATGGGPGEAHGDGAAGGRIVAEGGYEMLADGNGELAMTVADDWRGWLGPYLLDALLQAAAARGVPDLEADVLVTNRAMLSILRARGYATMGEDDWSTVRVVISTSGRVPSWPGEHDRPRILVEVPGARWHASEAARQAGLEVMVCPGPLSGTTGCPALAGHPCPLAAGADVVVVSHGVEEEQRDALVAAHRRVHPGIPVCVEVPRRATAGPHREPAAPSFERGADAATVAFVQRLALPARRAAGRRRSATGRAAGERPAGRRPGRGGGAGT